MQVAVDSKSVRKMADRMVSSPVAVIRDKSSALEAIAHALGYRNFDTLSGVLGKSRDTVAEKGVRPSVAKAFELIVRVRDLDGSESGAEWAVIRVDDAFLALLYRLRATCKEQGVLEVRFDSAPEDWDERERVWGRPNIRDWSLSVGQHGFFYCGHPKGLSGSVATSFVSFDDLERAMVSKTSELGTLRWESGLLSMHDYESVAEHMLSCLEDEADADALAEWTGLHYGVNYYMEPLDRRIGWARRFLEVSERD